MAAELEQARSGGTPETRVGVVVIGRNEGERLKRCLRSVVGQVEHVVYVDSGSTDDSVGFASSLGVDVVALDMSRPFTAARSRNAGFKRLLERNPSLEFVQFVDGDCEALPGWIAAATEFLQCNDAYGIVAGRLRERFPEASIYNRLCDLEWDLPIGELRSCGGNAMMRAELLRRTGGFDETLIAGEEPELCVRARAQGWRIYRIDHEMALHDADMHRFGQWWKRAVRAGHAYAEGALLHGRRMRQSVKAVASATFWAAGVPGLSLALAWPSRGLSLVLLPVAFGLLWMRIFRNERRRERTVRQARLVASYTIAAKFAQLVGVVMFWGRRMRGRKIRLIEYKAPAPTAEHA